MKRSMPVLLALSAACAMHVSAADAPRLTAHCSADNDLFKALRASGYECQRADSGRAAVERAAQGGAVLILADGYPAKTTVIDPEVLETAVRKNLRLFVEYPAALPGAEIGLPKAARFERAVVNSDFFGPSLDRLRILAINGLHFVPVKEGSAHLVAARVAGFDTAVFGLPQDTSPLLFELKDGNLLVATTKLSHFVTGRYAPQDAWQAVWSGVLAWLCPREPRPALTWTPSVRPTYGRDEPLPNNAERQAFRRGAEWFHRSKLLLHPSRLDEVKRAPGGLLPTPPPDSPVGDGTLGILEAPLSIVLADGSQKQGVARRGDCHGESAMALAFGAKSGAAGANADIARNLLDFYLFTSDARKRERGDPANGAYGLVAWGIDSPAWYTANYGDDNARLLLGTAAAAALLEESRWDEAMMMCLLANLRTTGRQGFRGDRIDVPALTSQGWQPFFRRNVVSYSPHMESYLWACYLWAYKQTGYGLFYERAENALRMTMAQYPNGWRWTNGLAQEKARMLLPLAWLVRVQDTPEHRAWLRTAVDGLVALQEPCGAIREELGLPGKGMFPPPSSNEGYGGAEASLIQRNGDPVCDLLYTANFAFLGLHEAAVTGDKAAAEAEEKLARFLCQIQVRSEAHPSLDGGWFRAFDFKRWEAWASNADAGWGAWAIESGWTQGWIVSVLGMRQMKNSLWDLVVKTGIAKDFDRLRREMLPDEALQSLQPTTLQHAAVGRPAALAIAPSERYPGGSLTDGRLGAADHTDPEWLGFEGPDLTATVDLGAVTAIRSLGIGCLQSVSVGIYFPPRVEFEVSDDGVAFRHAATVQPAAKPDESAPARVLLSSDSLNLRARYVRVHAANFGVIPAGLRSAGRPAWLFADELLVNPAPSGGIVPLTAAHAHNDYAHARPLLDALDHGFCSVEADIFATNGQLRVGHSAAELRPERTLEALYLEPLRQRVRQNGGHVYRDGPVVTLLVDFKTEPQPTYAALRNVLAAYSDILTSVEGGKVTPRAVTVILSGTAPRAELPADSPRYAMLDGRAADLDSALPPDLIPLISERWGALFTWRGTVPMPADQREKLSALVAKAHKAGRKVRFWGAPDSPAVWKELRAAGVDLLSVDDLDGVRKYLLQEGSRP